MKAMFRCRIFQLALFLLLSCWNLSGFAADAEQLYQIEIIVFSHVTNEALQSEYWPVQPPLTLAPNVKELTNDQLLPQTQWQLQSIQQILTKNKYPILLHLAWTLPTSNARQGQIIHLTNKGVTNNSTQVNGTVAVRLERYFSVHFNLQFLMPWEAIKDLNLNTITHNDANANVAFVIDQRLRMRSDELNYIDHPLYGVLVKIIPLTSSPAS